MEALMLSSSLPKTENAVRNKTNRTKPKLRLPKTNWRVTNVIYTDAFLKLKARHQCYILDACMMLVRMDVLGIA